MKVLKVMISMVVTAVAAATAAIFIYEWLQSKKCIEKTYDMYGHDVTEHDEDLFASIEEDAKLV